MSQESLLPIHFAPLQGYTDAIYRNAHASFFGGVTAYYTPFVRYEKGRFRSKDIRDIDPQNNSSNKIIPQLIASNIHETTSILDLFIDKGYRKVDINFGCPFPLLAKRHYGSGILPYPKEIESILTATEQYPEIDFSIKMRLGWEHPNECLELASMLNDTRLSSICLHPRLGKQQYKGAVDLEGFAAFHAISKHPLIYNGDLLTIEDINHISNLFPNLSGIMIGRGLLAHPALALEYSHSQTLPNDVIKEKLYLFHHEVFTKNQERLEGGDGQLLMKMKTFWEYLLPELDRKLKKNISKSTTIDKYRQSVSTLWNKL